MNDITQLSTLYSNAIARAEKAEEALRIIAGPRDCGCSPVCQCNYQESLEIEVDALRDIARAALLPPPPVRETP